MIEQDGLVGVRGFGPPTSASQTLRAKPDCATPRRQQYIKQIGSGQPPGRLENAAHG